MEEPKKKKMKTPKLVYNDRLNKILWIKMYKKAKIYIPELTFQEFLEMAMFTFEVVSYNIRYDCGKIVKIDGLGTFFPKRRTKELKEFNLRRVNNNLKVGFGVDKEEWIRKAAISRKLVGKEDAWFRKKEL